MRSTRQSLYHRLNDATGVRWRLTSVVILLMLCWPAAAGADATGRADDERFQRDRKAILAMAGNYHVTFSFRETVSFVEGYRLKVPYETDGYETVRVIRDDGEVISLQHILVVKGVWDDAMPVKHWRQDWRYEPEQIFEYLGRQTWRTRELDETERHGKWAQSVFEVDDSPRYAAVAEWTHNQGVSTWTSPPTWRPLPRREATKRSDYDVLVSVNRHALTPQGWVHEQDSTKLILGEHPQQLVREIGVNGYRASKEFNIQIADAYWNETQGFWADVREIWDVLQKEPGTLAVQRQGSLGKLHNRIAALANEIREGKLERGSAALRAREMIHASSTKNGQVVGAHTEVEKAVPANPQ
jgi:hypothetical protein